MDKDVKSETGQLTRARARRWALLCALRILRRSVLNRRPISLPNLLRFYRRRAGDMESLQQAGPLDTQWLVYIYMTEQPFHGTHWRQWCGAVASNVPRNRMR